MNRLVKMTGISLLVPIAVFSQSTKSNVKPGKNGAVTISPATATVITGQTQQFTATVTGMKNTAVIWTTSMGGISTSGFYTAPEIISVQTTATVTATSVADSTKLATATITLVPQTTPPSVSLNWSASTSLNIAGYNVYRALMTGGPYARITGVPTPQLTYQDINVSHGQTYFYVATAIDAGGNESGYSNEAVAAIP